jgi:hypothetical protein
MHNSDLQDSGFRIQGSGFRVWDSGLRVQGTEPRNQALNFLEDRFRGVGSGLGSGFGVLGLELRP